MYYHIRLFYSDGKSVLYHNVTKPEGLFHWAHENRFWNGRKPVRAFLYKLPYREAENGVYCAYWKPETGIVADVVNKPKRKI